MYQKWHPDKLKGEESATSKFQEINEAYQGNWSLFAQLEIVFICFSHFHYFLLVFAVLLAPCKLRDSDLGMNEAFWYNDEPETS